MVHTQNSKLYSYYILPLNVLSLMIEHMLLIQQNEFNIKF